MPIILKNVLAGLVAILVLLSLAGPAEAGSKGPGAAHSHHNTNVVVGFFQDYISPVDGDRCPMTPSCSSYAAQAMAEHGLVMGWIMACDRLVRCGRDEVDVSPHVRIKGRAYTSDPVSANDFWWFDRNGEGQ